MIHEGDIKDVINGIGRVAEIVGVTYGHSGKPVFIDQGRGAPPIVFDDGFQVAQSLAHFGANKSENIGVQLALQVAKEQSEKVGDGTTTAVLLFAKYVEYLLKNANPQDTKAFVERFVADQIEAISTVVDMYKKEATGEDIHNVALMATRNDEMATVCANAAIAAGKDGQVHVQKANERELQSERNILGTQLEVKPGFYWEATDVVAPVFLGGRAELSFKDMHVFFAGTHLESEATILAILTAYSRAFSRENRKPLVIVCNSIKGAALSTCVANNIKAMKNEGGIANIAVRLPIGFSGADAYDFSAATGTELFGEGAKIISEKTILRDHFGHLQEIIIKPNAVQMILDAEGEKRAEARVKELELTEGISSARLTRLRSGYVRVIVGGATDGEQSTNYEKVDDGIRACRSALKHGVVPSGGFMLKQMGEYLSDKAQDTKAVEVLNGILEMAGCHFRVEPQEQGHDSDKNVTIYNVATKKYVSKYELLEPANLLKTAVITAAKQAELVINTGAVLVWPE